MEPLEIRFRGHRIVLEAIVAWIASLGISFAARGAVPPRFQMPLILAAFCLALVFLTAFRWLSRIRMDREGVEWRRWKNTVSTRLEWDEVEELFLLGRDGFEVRGAGKAVRISGCYRIPWNARDYCSESLGGLRDRLRDRAMRDGELVFRMPSGRLKAHLVYLLAIVFLTGVTGLLVAPLFVKRRLGFPFFIVFFGGGWLWGLRRRASRLGTIVTLYRDGLLIRRLDGKDRVAWSDIASADWDGKGGLVLTLRSGKKHPLPPSLGNISLLEEFVEESRQAASVRS